MTTPRCGWFRFFSTLLVHISGLAMFVCWVAMPDACFCAEIAVVQFGPRIDQWTKAVTHGFKLRLASECEMRNLGLYNASFVPDFASELSADDAFRREAAAIALGLLGPPATSAVAQLIAAVADSNARVQDAAISALGDIGAVDKAVLAAMIDAVSKRPDLRWRAGATMGHLRLSDPAALQFLADSLSSTTALVRSGGADALGRIGPPAKAMIPALRLTLDDKVADVRIAVLLAMWRIDRYEEAVPKLAAMLDDKYAGDAQSQIIIALAAIGNDATSALGTVLTIGEDSDAYSAALYARWRIAADNRAIPLLRKLLRSTDDRHRIHAAAMLGAMGPPARDAYPDLRRVWIEDAHPFAASAAFQALTEIDVEAAWKDSR